MTFLNLMYFLTGIFIFLSHRVFFRKEFNNFDSDDKFLLFIGCFAYWPLIIVLYLVLWIANKIIKKNKQNKL